MTDIKENKTNQKIPDNSWLHDQSLSFIKVKNGLQVIATTLQSGIDEHKRELAKLVNARNLVRK